MKFLSRVDSPGRKVHKGRGRRQQMMERRTARGDQTVNRGTRRGEQMAASSRRYYARIGVDRV
jgi:hypothetical protein